MPKNQSLSSLPHALLIAVLCSLLSIAPVAAESQTASFLFDRYRSSVFQVRSIDLSSGDKTSIGSGFAVDGGSYIATNFHVISLLAHKPETYRLELIDHNGDSRDARIVAIDVVHDLALLGVDDKLSNSFRVRRSQPNQGERIFSMGNPQDLGMTIIEGNYNGLVQNSRYQKILFSGSLNPGMSGGPAIDSRGRLLGINVAKGSEQISFLVPAERLSKLIDKATTSARSGSGNPDFQQQIRHDLYNDQAQFYSALIEDEWTLEDFGELRLPQKISSSLKCWGHTVEDDDVRYDSFHQHCESTDAIYISSDFYTGQFEFDFEWLSTADLNSFQFYQAVEQRFHHKQLNSAYDDDDIGNYSCTTDVVNIADSRWKASSCFRAYKQYDDLFDAILLLASLDRPQQAGVLKVAASGISRNSARALFGKLLGAIAWKP